MLGLMRKVNTIILIEFCSNEKINKQSDKFIYKIIVIFIFCSIVTN